MANKPRSKRAATSSAVEAHEDETFEDTLNFEALPLTALRKYRARYNLPEPSPMTPEGFMLGGSVGKRTWSSKHLTRGTRNELTKAIEDHFAAEPIKETDTIVNFVYAVKHKDDVFKLNF